MQRVPRKSRRVSFLPRTGLLSFFLPLQLQELHLAGIAGRDVYELQGLASFLQLDSLSDHARERRREERKRHDCFIVSQGVRRLLRGGLRPGSGARVREEPALLPRTTLARPLIPSTSSPATRSTISPTRAPSPS